MYHFHNDITSMQLFLCHYEIYSIIVWRIYEKNAFTKKPMASTTKVMTAIIAIENNELNDIVKVSKKAANTGGSSVHLKQGQEIKLEELLYGLMIASGNDAAVAIAEHTAGSVEEFAKLMNAKAIELGAFNTNFVTPHGLDADGHYSTAYDMAIITRYALKNPTIAKLVSTQSKYMTFLDGTGRSLNNTNALLSSYAGANGVKTGITSMDWMGLVLICFVLPAVLTWLIAIPFRKKGWIGENDLKLDL